MNVEKATMGDPLVGLLQNSGTKEFAKAFKELQQEWETPGALLAESVAELALRSYETYYTVPVASPYFGLMAASVSSGIFPEERLWWPYLSHVWWAAGQRLRKPFRLPENGLSNQTTEDLIESFERAVEESDFDTCFQTVRALLDNPESREALREHSLALALQDTAYGGVKFIYLSVCWQVAESLDWKSSDRVLFPALHLLVAGDSDPSLVRSVRELEPAAARLLDGDAVPSLDLSTRVRQLLLHGNSRQDIFEVLEALSSAGVGWAGWGECLLCAAAQALTNARPGHWNRPLLAFLYTSLVFSEPAVRASSSAPLAGLTSAALIQEASWASRLSPADLRLDEVAGQFCPSDPFGTLRDVVSHSDPYAAATSMYAILGMGPDKSELLFQNLATLAAKNSGAICYGWDLLLVHAACLAYSKATCPDKDRLPLACAFFLGRVPKDYELIGAYGV